MSVSNLSDDTSQHRRNIDLEEKILIIVTTDLIHRKAQDSQLAL
jgi:hypothetical protein